MHGRGRPPHIEYEWRPGWAQGSGILPGGRLSGAQSTTVWNLRRSIRQRDAESCKRLLGQLPQAVDGRQHQQQDFPPRRQNDARWEMITPPYFRVAHEAVCGEEGAFCNLDISALDLVRFLHANGAPMDTPDADGRTPLWIAADHGKLDVMRYLLTECGASANNRDLGGWTPLNAAVERCDAKAVSILVEDGKADVNTRDDMGFTPLHAISEMGRLDMVQLLRGYGAEVEATCDDGETALHAMATGHWTRYRNKKDKDKCCDPLDGVKFLTGPSCQANVNAIDNGGRTPLLACVQNSSHSHKFEVMRYLHEECGADICVANNSGTALHVAASGILLEEVRYLIEKGVNPQLNDYDGDTPLHRVIEKMRRLDGEEFSSCLDILRFLASDECSALSPHGFRADVTALNDQGMTPLLQLLSYYRNPVKIIQPLRLLVDELGADVIGVSDNDGDTALHISVYGGDNWTNSDQSGCSFNPIVLNELLEKDGVEVDARNNEGLTPLHAVIKSGRSDERIKDCVCFLHSKGASIHTVANYGWTPLHTAAACGKRKVVQALVERGAELDIPDQNGLSPLQLADSRMRYSRELPHDYYWMTEPQLRDFFQPVVKYLRSVGSSAPTWWTPSNLVGRILCGKSQHALERFANATASNSASDTKARRPHVSHIVHAQRVLEGASIHGVEAEDKIRDLISSGDLLGAIDTLAEIAVQKATLKHKHCSICSNLLYDDEKNAEEMEPETATGSLSNGEKNSEVEDTQEARQVETGSKSSHKKQILCCHNSHPFHAGCLADLLLGGNFSCPVCRTRIPVAAAMEMNRLDDDLERKLGQRSLFPQVPQTVDATVATLEERARGISHGGENSVPRDGSPTICRDLLVRARNELLRDGQIDGTLLLRGPAALRAYSISSRQAFGMQGDIADDDGFNNGESEEEKEQEEETEKNTTAVTFPPFAACVGFGRGLLDPRVQQTMLAGDLNRIKIIRECVQQRLVELRADQKLAGDYAEEEKEQDECGDDTYDQSSVSMRKVQSKMRKQRAKKDRRLRCSEAVTTATNTAASDIAIPLFLARRELSVESEQAVKALRVSQGDTETSSDGSTIADASRAHRYLELAAPVTGVKGERLPIHMKPINPRSKAVLREAVSEGEVDSAARHLRRSRISARMEIGTVSEDFPVVDENRTGGSCKGGTKKQRKRRALLRRRQMILNEADSLGHPVCCVCDKMVTTALLTPPPDQLSMQLAAESLAERHASCVNGHAMHANCFSNLITAALPCPLCEEPLILPAVVRLGGRDEDCCAGGSDGEQNPTENTEEDVQLEARLDYMALSGLRFDDEDEFGRPTGGDDGASVDGDPLADLRQCPGCDFGPVYNKDCDDLNYHHGECQRCGTRTISRKKLDEIVARRLEEQRMEGRKKMSEMEAPDSDNPDNELSVPQALPDCKSCLSQGITSKPWYNGCMGCGMSFSSIPWDSLPPYEPPPEMYEGADNVNKVRLPLRRVYIDRVRRERRAIRLVASLQEQLHNEIVSLMHEARAVADEKRRRVTNIE